MGEQEPVKVYDAWNSQQAYFIRQLLADAGISARVASNAVETVSGRVPFQLATCPIWVTKADVTRARSILEEYDSHLKHRSPKEPQPPKPYCYHCGAEIDLQQSPCPECGCELDWSE